MRNDQGAWIAYAIRLSKVEQGCLSTNDFLRRRLEVS